MKGKTILHRIYTVFILFTLLISCSKDRDKGERLDIFEELQPGYDLIEFLSEMQGKDVLETKDSLNAAFEKIGLLEKKDLPFIVGSDTLTKPKGSYNWYNSKNRLAVLIFAENKDEKDSLWPEVYMHIGRYTGINLGGNGTYYLKNDSINHTSLNGTFKSHDKVFQLRVPLDFGLSEVEELEKGQWQEIKKANENIIETLKLLVEVLVSEKNKIYGPSMGSPISENERLIGFLNFWTEVKYNFAFFDQVPELDWQQVLLDYLPKVRNAESNLEYYGVLQEVCALLKDGHTNIYLPAELRDLKGKPSVAVTPIEGKLYITNIAVELLEMIPLGSQLMSVENVPVEDYIQKYVRPYISSSTEHIRRNMEATEVLEGYRTDSVHIEIQTPQGQLKELALSRIPSDGEWAISQDQWKLFEFKRYGDIAYVSLNSFGTEKIVDEFESYLDSLRNSKALIIDLRQNGGGNSWNGYNILRHLSDRPLITSKWRTREHKPAYKAWGAFVEEGSDNLGSWDRESLASFKDDYWFESGPDTIAPGNEGLTILPTLVLMSNNTASAAEDFLVAADPLENIVTMGDYSYGSTGQPMFIRLPGGGKARICTKRDTYPNGREFVGYGIEPDIPLSMTLGDILENEDSVLKGALEYLKNELKYK